MATYIKVPEATARSIATQLMSDLEDSDFEKAFMRIVREAKYRRNLDFENILEKVRRAWAVEKNKTANCDREP